MPTRSEYLDELLDFVAEMLTEQGVKLSKDEQAEVRALVTLGFDKAKRESRRHWQIRYEESILTMIDKLVKRTRDDEDRNQRLVTNPVDTSGRIGEFDMRQWAAGREIQVAGRDEPVSLKAAICPLWPFC